MFNAEKMETVPKGKQPAFQFYTGDFLKDPALRSVSVAARGLWIDLMCILFESKSKYKLEILGDIDESTAISRMTGVPKKQVKKLVRELEVARVFVRDVSGNIYSKRMQRDEELRNIRREAGKLGGNPNLVKHQSNQELSKF